MGKIFITDLGDYQVLKQEGEYLDLAAFEATLNNLQKTLTFLKANYDPDYPTVAPIVDDYLTRHVTPLIQYPYDMPKKGAYIKGVYFAVCDVFPEEIKIGRTDTLRVRMSTLGKDYKSPVKPIAFIPTEDHYRVEQLLHFYFADSRGDGEWFLKTPVLYALENGL